MRKIAVLLFFVTPLLTLGQTNGGAPANAIFTLYIDTFATPPYPYSSNPEGTTFQHKHYDVSNGIFPYFNGSPVADSFFKDTVHVLYMDEGDSFLFRYTLDNGDWGYETYFDDMTIISFETPFNKEVEQTYHTSFHITEEGLLTILCPILGEVTIRIVKNKSNGLDADEIIPEPLIKPIANSSSVLVFPSGYESNSVTLTDLSGRIIEKWTETSPFEVDMSRYSGNLFFFFEQNQVTSRKSKYLKL